MFKLLLPSLVILCFVATCFAQTFQYSHGWTNGKRAFLNAQREGGDIPEIFVIQQDGDRELERCLLQLQYFLRNPLQIGAGVETLTPEIWATTTTSNNQFGHKHQSNALFEKLNNAEANDYGKH